MNFLNNFNVNNFQVTNLTRLSECHQINTNYYKYIHKFLLKYSILLRYKKKKIYFTINNDNKNTYLMCAIKKACANCYNNAF
jgi:hypothetical protein